MTSGKKTKWLDPSDIDAGLNDANILARRDGIAIAVAGGVALQYYGSDRLTKDLDFLADGIPAVDDAKPLSFGGVAFMSASGVPTDFIVRDDDYADLYANALVFSRFVKDIGMRVVTAEYMLAIKLGAGRAKDLADMEFLVLDAELNYEGARDIVKRYMGTYAARELDRYKDSIAFERSRRKP
jgi:hypothetical protein